MVTIILGKPEIYNRKHHEGIAENYLPSLRLTRSGSKGFANYIKKIMRPILGGRILISLYENEPMKKRDFDGAWKSIEPYKDHPYVDIVWIIEETYGDFNHIYIDVNIIRLRNTYRDDLLGYACTVFEPDIATAFLEKVKYSWKRYGIYADKLLSIQRERKITFQDLDEIIEVENNIPIHEILFKLLCRTDKSPVNQRAVREYYKVANKYSYSWLNAFIEELLEDVIELKIKYYIKETVKIRNMVSNDRQKHLVKLVTEIPIYSLYNMLTIFRESNNPIETYILYRGKYMTESAGLADFLEITE